MVAWMVRFAQKGAQDPVVIETAEQICKGVSPGDYSSEILACYHWVLGNVRYRRDPNGNELVKEPRQTLRTLAGDCDDISVLLCALLEAVGNKTALVLAGFRNRSMPSHVFCAVKVPDGLVVVDPVANTQTTKMLGEMTGWKVIVIQPETWAVGATEGALAGSTQPVFSVYDQASKEYSYWKAAALVPTVSWFRPPAGGLVKGVFRVPESLGVQLPAGAVEVGRGGLAMGVIAVPRGGGLGALTPTGQEGGLTWKARLGWVGLGIVLGVVGARRFAWK